MANNFLQPSFYNNSTAENPDVDVALAAEQSNARAVLSLAGATTLQTVAILDGAITPAGAHIAVDTEGQSAADDLMVINAVRSDVDVIHEGMVLQLQAADDSRVVTVKHSSEVGGIRTISGQDIVLGTTWRLELQYIGGSWVEVVSKSEVTKEDFNAKFSLTAKEGTAPLAQLDPDTGEVVFDDSWKMGGGGGMPIGASIAVYCTSTYTPFGAVPQDGASYSESQFPNVVEYIEDGYIPWKTPTDYDAEVAAHGKCGCFAWDATARTFRVPLMPDGTFIQQAMSDSELGKSYDAGLPNIEAVFPTPQYGSVIWSGATPDRGSKVTNLDWMVSNAGAIYNTPFSAQYSSPIYGNSDTVQPSAIALRHFVVVATETDQQSVMDWSAWASALGGKANTDLSNVTFGSLDFSLFTPDYDNLVPLPAALYTVTKAGFVRIHSETGGQWKINGEQVFYSAHPDLTLVPVGVGDVVDSTGGANSNFAFIPFKGAV